MKTFHNNTRHIFTFVIVLFTLPAVAEPVEISIGVAGKYVPEIVKVMKLHPNVCAEDAPFSPDWFRTVLEFIIVCRAISSGGIDATYSLVSYPNAARAKAELIKGHVMINIALPWKRFQDESIYQSSAVIRVGEYIKGIYTRPDHIALLNVKTLKELRAFTAVCDKNWFYDWGALERMGVNKISAPTWSQMGKMVKGGRADYLLSEFTGNDGLSRYIDNTRFIPVPGIKIILQGSRHVTVSKKFPHSKEVFDALQIGLKNMHNRGIIKKGYRVSGFSSPLVDDWKVICCELITGGE